MGGKGRGILHPVAFLSLRPQFHRQGRPRRVRSSTWPASAHLKPACVTVVPRLSFEIGKELFHKPSSAKGMAAPLDLPQFPISRSSSSLSMPMPKPLSPLPRTELALLAMIRILSPTPSPLAHLGVSRKPPGEPRCKEPSPQVSTHPTRSTQIFRPPRHCNGRPSGYLRRSCIPERVLCWKQVTEVMNRHYILCITFIRGIRVGLTQPIPSSFPGPSDEVSSRPKPSQILPLDRPTPPPSLTASELNKLFEPILSYADAEEATPFCPLILSIGAKPQPLLCDAAVAAAPVIKEILAQAGFENTWCGSSLDPDPVLEMWVFVKKKSGLE